MNNNPQSRYKYHVGGNVPVDAPTYIKRAADDEFYDALKQGEFCYVLNCRQMGKSSLMVQTMRRLEKDGYACVSIDISHIGTLGITPEQWYRGIIEEISNSLELYEEFDSEEWWKNHHDVSMTQKFRWFLEKILLKLITKPIVIFIDEIDSVLSLPFKADDFFALIRACYNHRVNQPIYKRLTFALLGVATPTVLIQDKRRTPFNIGRAIELTGFKLEESNPLSQGFSSQTNDPKKVLEAILHWTGGQPFLTQKICRLIQNKKQNIPPNKEVEWIENLVQEQILTNWEVKDEPEHLRTIQNRILRSQERTGRLLGFYQRILQNQEIESDDSLEKLALRLSGLVVENQGKINVYNKIYATVFNLNWVEKHILSLKNSYHYNAYIEVVGSLPSDKSIYIKSSAYQEFSPAFNHPLSYYDYQVGGSLPVDAPTYIKRSTDQEFYDALKQGEFCYVFNCRQMGKSSVRVQTMRRLEQEGYACSAIDITIMGTDDVTPEQWYFGLIDNLVGDLELYNNFDLYTWWKQNNLLSSVQLLSKFIDEVLLEEIQKNIIIFVDEIDSLLSLPFKADDFFALIRACYNLRVDQPKYQRLTFALLGVATPTVLIQDKRRTPFNIGRGIELTGFQLTESYPLAVGLRTQTEHPEKVLKAILYWTGGQPFLTQKLCKLIRETNQIIPQNQEAEWVENLVQNRIINDWEEQDEPGHLRTIRDQILRPGSQHTGRLLGIYQQILQQKGILAEDNPDQVMLRLSGLVVKHEGKIEVYNQIYAEVFNLTWVEKALADLRPYSEAFNAWEKSGRQDESRLLQGEVLKEAIEWAKGKNISSEDYQYLAASEALDKRATQAELDAQRKAYQILVKAKQRATLINIVFGAALAVTLVSLALVVVRTTPSNYGQTGQGVVNPQQP